MNKDNTSRPGLFRPHHRSPRYNKKYINQKIFTPAENFDVRDKREEKMIRSEKLETGFRASAE